MTNRSIESRRRAFVKAGLEPQFYDQLMDVIGRNLVAMEPGAAPYVSDLGKLKEVYAVMNDVWDEEVLKPTQKPQEEIPFDELYSLPGYLTALLECWHNWTLKSTALAISFVRQHPELQQHTVFVCDGFGASSIMYAKAFPNILVTAHIMGESQLSLCKALTSELNLPNLQVVNMPYTAPIVMAFETFEHFYDPITFAADFLSHAKMLCHSSPWTVPAHGHFAKYKMNGAEVDRSDMPKLFGKWLKGLGFVNTSKVYGFRHWNGEPEQYVRGVNQLDLPNV